MQDRIDTERLILEFDITNEELANAANITLDTASRILREWRRTGAVRKQRRKIA
jgi:CRP-like cAMP-binding protein